MCAATCRWMSRKFSRFMHAPSLSLFGIGCSASSASSNIERQPDAAPKNGTTPAGIEPARAKPNSLATNLLNHSDTVPVAGVIADGDGDHKAEAAFRVAQARYQDRKGVAATLFGQLLHANDMRRHGSQVAIKEANCALAARQRTAAGACVADNMDAELQVLQQLQGVGGFVQLVEHVTGSVVRWLVMEWIDGYELFDLHDTNPSTIRRRPDPWCCELPAAVLDAHPWAKHAVVREAMHVWVELVDSISWLHRHGIAHCDLSAENVMVSVSASQQRQQQHVTIIDFGSACCFRPDAKVDVLRAGSAYRAETEHRSPIRTPDFICSPVPGKVQYMAPELLDWQPYDVRHADWFASAVLLYFLFTGSAAFRRASVTLDERFRVIDAGRLHVLCSPHVVKAAIPKPAIDLMQQMLYADRTKRACTEAAIRAHPWTVACVAFCQAAAAAAASNTTL